MFSNFTGFLFFCQVQNTQNTNTLTDWSCKITTFWILCKQLQLRNEKCVCCCFEMMQVFTSILQILATLALGFIVVLRQQNSGLSVNLHSSWFYSKCRLPPYMHEQCIVSFHKQREENPTQYTKRERQFYRTWERQRVSIIFGELVSILKLYIYKNKSNLRCAEGQHYEQL